MGGRKVYEGERQCCDGEREPAADAFVFCVSFGVREDENAIERLRGSEGEGDGEGEGEGNSVNVGQGEGEGDVLGECRVKTSGVGETDMQGTGRDWAAQKGESTFMK